MKIDILSTGGTFEKIYGSGAGVKNFSFPDSSVVDEICGRLGINDVEISYDAGRAKDSLDMDESDRIYIANYCANKDRCVVIHGTDTMIETAKVIADKNLGNVVILTGALQPARMKDSDADFNLGGAIIASQACPLRCLHCHVW